MKPLLTLVKFRVLWVLISLLSTTSVFAAPRPVDFNRSGPLGSTQLWREGGDRVAVRHRIVPKRTTREDQAIEELETEVTLLDSGCSFSLIWAYLPMASERLTIDKPKRLKKPPTWIQTQWAGPRQDTHGVAVEFKVPSQARLLQLSWYGCSWAHPLNTQEVKRPTTTKATLPNGARSTPAIPLGTHVQTAPLEKQLKIDQRDDRLELRSEKWAFAAQLSVSDNTLIHQEADWVWRSKDTVTPDHHGVQVHLEIWHAHTQSDSLAKAPITSKTEAFNEWAIWLDFLSTTEGVTDGLGAQGGHREWASLALLALVEDAEFEKLDPSWCEAVLRGALSHLPPWPHAYKSYEKPLLPMDGRLWFPIALSQYFLKHPEGLKRAPAFLNSRIEGQLVGSMVKQQIQALIGRASYFANRPSRRNLVAIHPTPHSMREGEQLQYGFVESVVLVPRALKALSALLSHEQLKAPISAPLGLAERAQKLEKSWHEKSRSFFVRQLEVYATRSRVEQWGRLLGLDDPEEPALKVIKDFKTYEASLNSTPPQLSGLSGLDLLWGNHELVDLNRLLNLSRHYPAGLLTPVGILPQQHLVFESELKSQPRSARIPSVSATVSWILGVGRQLKRGWGAKIRFILEDLRIDAWNGLLASVAPPTAERPFDPWLSDDLSALYGMLLTLSEPPPIEIPDIIDPRELR